MKRLFFFLIYLIILTSFVNAENRIFSGAFNDSYFDVTPMIPAHISVEAYPEGSSPFYVLFYPSNTQYAVNESHIYFEKGISYFYFITDVPENTDKIGFYYYGNLIKEINAYQDIKLSGFNISYAGENITFSWNCSLNDYYASVYYNESGMWTSLIFEYPLSNSYEFTIPLSFISFSGERDFKLVISDVFNEKEAHSSFNMSNISYKSAASEVPPASDGSSSREISSQTVLNSKSSQTPVTSKVIKENIQNKEIMSNQSENKKGFLSRAIDVLKRVVEFLFRR